jgi:hypothetical protein
MYISRAICEFIVCILLFILFFLPLRFGDDDDDGFARYQGVLPILTFLSYNCLFRFVNGCL